MISRDIEYSRDLVLALVSKELKVRYKSTFLGYFWSLLHPTVLAAVYYFAFAVIMRAVDVNNYLLYLFAGLFPWQAFGNTVGMSSNYFLGNASLIKKTRFPRYVLVIASIVNEQVHFFISYVLLSLLVLCLGRSFMWQAIWLVPVLILMQSTMMFGLSLIMATGNLFFRDLDRLTGLFLMIWFWLTPIIYQPSNIPDRFRHLMLYGNPIAPIISCWQSLILNDAVKFPILWDALGAAAIWTVVIAGGGYAFYKKMQWRFAEIV